MLLLYGNIFWYLCVSLWTLEWPVYCQVYLLSQPLSQLPVLVYCLFCDAQTPLSCVKNEKLSIIRCHHWGKLYGIMGHSKGKVDLGNSE